MQNICIWKIEISENQSVNIKDITVGQKSNLKYIYNRFILNFTRL